MMPIETNSVFLVLSNPLPGREEDYNRWYSDQHMEEVVERPGVVSARRFRLGKGQLNPEGMGFSQGDHMYLAVYEIEGDPDAVIGHIRGEMEQKAPGMTLTDALHPNVYTGVFSAITDTLLESQVTKQVSG